MSIKKNGKIFLTFVIASMIIFNMPFTSNVNKNGLLAAKKASLSQAITITSIDDINETININDRYTLPRTVKATMSNGSTKSVKVKWNSSKVNTKIKGETDYTGTVIGYDNNVNLKLTVIGIASIEDISQSVYINDNYTFPKEVTATMSDGSTKEVKVKWNKSKANTSTKGETDYTGKVIGYENETVNLKLTVIGIASIEDISESVYINDSYTFTKEVTATMDDGSTRSVTVKWKTSKAKTSEAGETPYAGTVIGYDNKTVNLKLTVIGIASIEDISESVYINDSYTFPKEVKATMDDGSTRSVTVKWKSSKAKTSEAGETPYTGTVIGYDNKTVNLKLTVIGIASIEDISESVYINDSYTFPKEVKATMDDGSTRSVTVKWKSSKAKTSEAGETPYTGTVIGYDNKTVNLKLTVIGIASIEDISESVYINDSYTFPKEVKATMDDGSTRSVTVKWKSSKVKTNEAGVTDYTGTVIGYGNKTVNLKLTVIGIATIEDISETIDINDIYTLPKTVIAIMDDGTTKSLEVKWNTSKVDTSKVTQPDYTGTVNGYKNKVKLTLIINSITSISSMVSATVNQYDSYTLPATVTATMDDGRTKSVEVKWNPAKAKTSSKGKTSYIGTISGYDSKITFTLNVNPITLLTPSVNFGDNYTLPTKVDAIMSDGSKKKDVGVIWDSSEVDTSKLGKQTYTGKLNGYMNKVKLELTVKEENPITSVEFNTIKSPTHTKLYDYTSALDAYDKSGKDPIIKGITLTSSASSKSIRLDIDNIAETKYNALYIDKNSNGKYDKGTDSIIGQFTITTTGKFANTYNGLVDGIKVVAGDNGSILFKVYNVDGSKVKKSITLSVRF